MDQVPADVQILEQTYELLNRPTSYNELNYVHLIKPAEASLLKHLDRAVDEYGTFLIKGLKKNVQFRERLGQAMARPHTSRGIKFGIVGLGAAGGSSISSGNLSKTLFVASLILCCGSAASLAYSGLILHTTTDAQIKDRQTANLTDIVQEKMRLAIASQLEHRSKDQIVQRGAERFDQQDQNFDDHKSQLVIHGKKHSSHETQFSKLTQKNKEQALQLVEQAENISKQEHKLGEQEHELGEYKEKLGKQEHELGEYKEKLGKQERELGEYKEKLADLTDKFKTLETLLLARVS